MFGFNAKLGQFLPVSRRTAMLGSWRLLMPNWRQEWGNAGSQLTW